MYLYTLDMINEELKNDPDCLEKDTDGDGLDDYAYVADGSGGLQVVDVSNPASPVVVGSCDTPGSAGGVFVSGQ